RDIQKRGLGRCSLSVHQIHDRPLVFAHDSRVRFGYEIANRRRVPMIAASQTAAIVQTLLHDGPLALRGYDEAVKIDLKSVGDGIVVDARGQAAGANEPVGIEPSAPCNHAQLGRSVSRVSAPATADVDSEFIRA